MVRYRNWDDAREEGRQEGLKEVREERREAERQEVRAEILRRQVALKFGEVSPELAQRLAAAPPDEIDRLLDRIVFADSIDALFA